MLAVRHLLCLAAITVALTACSDSPPPTVAPSPTTEPTAPYADDFAGKGSDASCDVLPSDARTVDFDVATEDSEELAAQLIDTNDPTGDVRAVGVGKCDDLHFVMVGVRDRSTWAPRNGPRGTAVVRVPMGIPVGD